jgi:hypothetical protein
VDQVIAARAALDRALDDVDRAITRVRAAQEVDWVSVLASRYREELYATIQQLVHFRDWLERLRAGLA